MNTLFSNLLSECFSSVVSGGLCLREPNTWNKLHIFPLYLRLERDA